MSDFSLSIATYDRGTRWDENNVKKPYHWAFILAPSNNTSKAERTYQLRGMPGGFYYLGEEDMEKCSDVKEVLEVGVITAGKIDRFKQILNAVQINNDESTKWNCQSWTLEALDLLRSEGFISEDYPNNVIQHWLRED